MMERKEDTYGWFSTKVSYNGQGCAEFQDPAGMVKGHASVSFDEFGQSRIEMTIEEIVTEQPLRMGLMELFSGSKPVKTEQGWSLPIGGLENRCTRLTVTTDEGRFSTLQSPHYGYSLRADGDNAQKLTFHPLGAEFNASNCGDPYYWVIPLSNFTSRFLSRHQAIDTHVLKLVGGQETQWAIAFEFGDGVGFIEPMPDYDRREQDLKDGRERHLITALMIGSVGSNETDGDKFYDWVPFDFLRLLSFATGTTVGSPWSELRSKTGDVVRRIHRNDELESFSRGHRTIDELVHSGAGYLLTQYQKCADRGQPFLSVVLKHIMQGGTYDGSIEDITVYLCRALDGLCDRYGFKYQNLLTELDSDKKKEVTDILDAAKQQLRSAARKARREGLLDQSRVMERIAERVRSNAANRDVDFGLAVTGLLKRFDLPDADILDKHYQNLPRADGIDTWSGVISHYRGTTMHRGHYQISEKKHDFEDVIRINDHLLDVLIRIVFKIVGYEGTYQPSVIKATTRESVDWVKSDLAASRLGY
ncbi:MAG TPA: hypothetical protein VK582_09165 [Pyrinomonadaceae bacterium]|nr:hypothetical protein [Pyrinomonadaceae bacterium]